MMIYIVYNLFVFIPHWSPPKWPRRLIAALRVHIPWNFPFWQQICPKYPFSGKNKSSSLDASLCTAIYGELQLDILLSTLSVRVNSRNPRTGNPFFEILSFAVSFARVLTNQISVDKNIFYAVALSLHEEQRDEKRPSGDKLSKILQGGGQPDACKMQIEQIAPTPYPKQSSYFSCLDERFR